MHKEAKRVILYIYLLCCQIGWPKGRHMGSQINGPEPPCQAKTSTTAILPNLISQMLSINNDKTEHMLSIPIHIHTWLDQEFSSVFWF